MTASPTENPEAAALAQLEKQFPDLDTAALRAHLMMAQASQGSGELLGGEGTSTGRVTIASNGNVSVQDATPGGASSCVQAAQQGLQSALATAQKSSPIWLRIAEELVAYATYYITIDGC